MKAEHAFSLNNNIDAGGNAGSFYLLTVGDLHSFEDFVCVQGKAKALF
jgi:hypothetical protein